jgi:hypothetical protein
MLRSPAWKRVEVWRIYRNTQRETGVHIFDFGGYTYDIRRR